MFLFLVVAYAPTNPFAQGFLLGSFIRDHPDDSSQRVWLFFVFCVSRHSPVSYFELGATQLLRIACIARTHGRRPAAPRSCAAGISQC